VPDLVNRFILKTEALNY